MTKVVLYSKNAQLIKSMRDAFGEKNLTLHETTKLPASADLVISTAATNTKDEWTAARHGCMVAILPEALDYVIDRANAKGNFVIIGADRGKS